MLIGIQFTERQTYYDVNVYSSSWMCLYILVQYDRKREILYYFSRHIFLIHFFLLVGILGYAKFTCDSHNLDIINFLTN
jgi:hypothetical protein